jgi:hypothetical protein
MQILQMHTLNNQNENPKRKTLFITQTSRSTIVKAGRACSKKRFESPIHRQVSPKRCNRSSVFLKSAEPIQPPENPSSHTETAEPSSKRCKSISHR